MHTGVFSFGGYRKQFNTCSTGTGASRVPTCGVMALAIVCPTTVKVSVNPCRLGRLAGVAENIGTSGMVSFVAVPTTERNKHFDGNKYKQYIQCTK